MNPTKKLIFFLLFIFLFLFFFLNDIFCFEGLTFRSVEAFRQYLYTFLEKFPYKKIERDRFETYEQYQQRKSIEEQKIRVEQDNYKSFIAVRIIDVPRYTGYYQAEKGYFGDDGISIRISTRFKDMGLLDVTCFYPEEEHPMENPTVKIDSGANYSDWLISIPLCVRQWGEDARWIDQLWKAGSLKRRTFFNISIHNRILEIAYWAADLVDITRDDSMAYNYFKPYSAHR